METGRPGRVGRQARSVLPQRLDDSNNDCCLKLSEVLKGLDITVMGRKLLLPRLIGFDAKVS